MKIARNVAEIVRQYVSLKVACIDWLYLNVCTVQPRKRVVERRGSCGRFAASRFLIRLEEWERGLVVTDGEHRASMSRVSRAGGRRRLEQKYGQTPAAHMREMERLGRQRGRLRRSDRGA